MTSTVYLLLLLMRMAAAGGPGESLTSYHSLAVYCKVWGFLKYYHPAVGEHLVDWDRTFVEYYPQVKQAVSVAELNRVLWILYQVADRAKAAIIADEDESEDAGTQIADFSWIRDSSLLEKRLIDALTNLQWQEVPTEQYYVHSVDKHNPDLSRDTAYYSVPFPNEALRALAAARYWNIINYYYPYKDVIGTSWDSILSTYLPKVIEAADTLQYLYVMAEYCRKINDAHANLHNERLIQHLGTASVPVELGSIEGKTVVTGGYNWAANQDSLLFIAGLRKGDVVIAINDEPIESVRARLRPIVPGSNNASYEREINQRLLRGQPGDTATLLINDGFDVQEIKTTYILAADIPKKERGPEAIIFDGNIGYMDLSTIQDGDYAMKLLMKLRHTRGIIIDHRRAANVTIANYLTTKATFAFFTVPNYEFPGYLKKGTTSRIGFRTVYDGPVVVLVGPYTQSNIEYKTMALQARSKVTTIGSQTAGADGSVSGIWLPGRIKAFFSGIGVFYPDGTPTQRVGVRIDKEVRTTIQGIRDDIDEVLEYAIEYLKDD